MQRRPHAASSAARAMLHVMDARLRGFLEHCFLQNSPAKQQVTIAAIAYSSYGFIWFGAGACIWARALCSWMLVAGIEGVLLSLHMCAHVCLDFLFRVSVSLGFLCLFAPSSPRKYLQTPFPDSGAAAGAPSIKHQPKPVAIDFRDGIVSWPLALKSRVN